MDLLSRSAAIKYEDYGASTLQKGEYRRFKLYFRRTKNMKYLKLIGPDALVEEEDSSDNIFEHSIIRH